MIHERFYTGVFTSSAKSIFYINIGGYQVAFGGRREAPLENVLDGVGDILIGKRISLAFAGHRSIERTIR